MSPKNEQFSWQNGRLLRGAVLRAERAPSTVGAHWSFNCLRVGHLAATSQEVSADAPTSTSSHEDAVGDSNPVPHMLCKQGVTGSSPVASTNEWICGVQKRESSLLDAVGYGADHHLP